MVLVYQTGAEKTIVLSAFILTEIYWSRDSEGASMIYKSLARRQLSLKKALYPTYEPSQNPATLTIKGIIVCALAIFLATVARGDLFRRPLVGPSNFTSIYPVMRLASLLPVPHRREAYPRFLEDKINELKQKKWSWHNLRHRRASIWATNGLTTFEIMSRLGHSNLSTTMIYLQLLGFTRL
jgi:hypothetical protein